MGSWWFGVHGQLKALSFEVLGLCVAPESMAEVQSFNRLQFGSNAQVEGFDILQQVASATQRTHGT